MTNWELFYAAYQATSPEVRLLVDSEKIAVCVEAALARRNMPQLQTKATTQISYQVVGAQTIDKTVESLSNLGLPDALQFLAEVQTCVKGHDTKAEQAPVIPSPSETLQSEISAAEHDLETIKGIRTMAHDMQEAKIHPIQPIAMPEITHQSSQADILKPATPAPTQSTAPRWDTER